MIDFFVYRIKNGLKKWIDVPPLWLDQVKEKLISEGYIIKENGTVTKGD